MKHNQIKVTNRYASIVYCSEVNLSLALPHEASLNLLKYMTLDPQCLFSHLIPQLLITNLATINYLCELDFNKICSDSNF